VSGDGYSWRQHVNIKLRKEPEAPAVALSVMTRLMYPTAGGAIYVSAKRTQFIFAYLSMYHNYLQQLVMFALEFANGFVSENEPIFEGIFGGLEDPGAAFCPFIEREFESIDLKNDGFNLRLSVSKFQLSMD
jgi:hypothetical protein